MYAIASQFCFSKQIAGDTKLRFPKLKENRNQDKKLLIPKLIKTIAKSR